MPKIHLSIPPSNDFTIEPHQERKLLRVYTADGHKYYRGVRSRVYLSSLIAQDIDIRYQRDKFMRFCRPVDQNLETIRESEDFIDVHYREAA